MVPRDTPLLTARVSSIRHPPAQYPHLTSASYRSLASTILTRFFYHANANANRSKDVLPSVFVLATVPASVAHPHPHSHPRPNRSSPASAEETTQQPTNTRNTIHEKHTDTDTKSRNATRMSITAVPKATRRYGDPHVFAPRRRGSSVAQMPISLSIVWRAFLCLHRCFTVAICSP